MWEDSVLSGPASLFVDIDLSAEGCRLIAAAINRVYTGTRLQRPPSAKANLSVKASTIHLYHHFPYQIHPSIKALL